MTWASLIPSTAVTTEKMEQRARHQQKPSLFFKNFHALSGWGGISVIFPQERHQPFFFFFLFDSQNPFWICFHCKRNLKWTCLLESMIGEVEKGKIYVHNLEHEDMWILQYLYFERDVLLVRKKKGGRQKKKRAERHSHLLSTGEWLYINFLFIHLLTISRCQALC